MFSCSWGALTSSETLQQFSSWKFLLLSQRKIALADISTANPNFLMSDCLTERERPSHFWFESIL
jgi:hypothetical protein